MHETGTATDMTITATTTTTSSSSDHTVVVTSSSDHHRHHPKDDGATYNDDEYPPPPPPPHRLDSVRCVVCLSPHTALVRRLGTKCHPPTKSSTGSDIQLLSCHYCSSRSSSRSTVILIDPYCERELVLVLLLDVLILFRTWAVRHLLFNRDRLHILEEDDDDWIEPTSHSTKTVPSLSSQRRLQQQRIQQIRLLFLASVVIRSHICIIASNHHHPTHPSIDDLLPPWIIYVFLSAVGYILQIIGAIGLCLFVQSLLPIVVCHTNPMAWTVSSSSSSSSSTTPSHSSSSSTRQTKNVIQSSDLPYLTYLCTCTILYPSVCIHGATSLIHIWENSNTVRSIGAMVVLVHQSIFLIQLILVIQMNHSNTNTTSVKENSIAVSSRTRDNAKNDSGRASQNNDHHNKTVASSPISANVHSVLLMWTCICLIWISIFCIRSMMLHWWYRQWSLWYHHHHQDVDRMTCPGWDGTSLSHLWNNQLWSWHHPTGTSLHWTYDYIEQLCLV